MAVLIQLLFGMFVIGLLIIIVVVGIPALFYWLIMVIGDSYEEAKIKKEKLEKEIENNREYTIEEAISKGVIKRLD